MRNLLPMLLLAVAAPGFAQKMDSFDFHASNVVLLQAKPVQKELGVTQAQRDKMNVYARAHRAKVVAYQNELQRQKKTINPTRPDQRLLALFQELKKNALAQLKPAQLKRLREISLQQVKLTALMDGVVAKRVGMSDAQLKSFRKTYGDGQKKIYAAERAAAVPVLKPYDGRKPKDKEEQDRLRKEVSQKLQAASQKIRPQIITIIKDTERKLQAILTPAQKKAFLALQGKPFTPKK